MIRPSRVARLLALLLGLTLVAAACSSDGGSAGDGDSAETTTDSGSTETETETETEADGDTGDAGSTLTIAADGDYAPTGFDPLLYSLGQFAFYGTLYDALFVTDETGQVVPSAVASYETSEDGLTLVLTLRDDIAFEDGSPLDAALVKANLDRRTDPALTSYGQFSEGQETEITNVEATGDYEVTITWALEQPEGHALLVDTAGIIVGPAGLADPAALESAPDGSGAYAYVADQSTRASTYTVSKKDATWNADAWAFDTIVFNVIADDQARANAAASGEADVALQLAANTVELVEAEAAVNKAGGVVASYPVMDKDGVVHPAFAFTETRLALSYAVDREAIVEALRPGARPTAQLFPADAVGFDPSIDERYAYDPDKARELLASVGFEDGFEFDMVVFGEPTEAQLAVQAGWQADLNVTMNFVIATSMDQVFGAVTTTPLIYNEEWGLGPQPAGFVAGVVVGGFMNLLGAENEVISAALGPALGGDEQALTDLNNALADEGWWIGLWEDFVYAGYNPEVVEAPPFAGIGGYVVTSGIKPAG